MHFLNVLSINLEALFNFLIGEVSENVPVCNADEYNTDISAHVTSCIFFYPMLICDQKLKHAEEQQIINVLLKQQELILQVLCA